MSLPRPLISYSGTSPIGCFEFLLLYLYVACIPAGLGLSRARMTRHAKLRACSCIDWELGLEMPIMADWERERSCFLPACSDVGKDAAPSQTDAERVDVVLVDSLPEFESLVVVVGRRATRRRQRRCGADRFCQNASPSW